jgi:hypothetical protein
MAKISGIPSTVSLDDGAGSPTVITNDVTSLSFNSPQTLEDVTGLNSVAIERLKTLSDFTGELTGWFNAALSHPVLKTIWSSTIASRTLVLTFGTGPAATLTAEVLLSDYSFSLDNGKLVWKVPFSNALGTVPAWT